MQRLELPAQKAQNLIAPEKASGFTFQLTRVGVAVALLGAIAFMLAFFYQKPLNAANLPYRQVQAISIVVVFAGWVLFSFACSAVGVSTRKLTYEKLKAILRNEVEIPMDVSLVMRRKIALALSALDDRWALYPVVFNDQAIRRVPMVLAGPGGVFALDVVSIDPRDKNKFVDPAPRIIAGSAELEKRLHRPVKPVVVFFRHKNHYKNDAEILAKYTFQELEAHVKSRPETIEGVDLASVHDTLRKLAKMPETSF
ncbi:MAG TPA: hypothetical protein VHO48_04540 [Anaerolineaceae bacterium]|nr:hypothetical protein [Anaerolineaceae bacterium]